MRILVALLALVAPCTSFMHGSHAVSGLALRSPAAQLAAHRHSRVRRLVAPRAQAEIMSGLGDVVSGLLLAAEEVEKASFVPSAGGYSSASLYATLGLYIISLPGLWSIIKRSVSYKPINKDYETDGPSKGKEVRQTAAEIVAYFSAMNFTPEPSNDVMTFRGTMGRSRGQAAFLSFCTFLSLASLAIVLTIQFPLVEDVSQNSPWWYITLASPLAGVYYWLTASKEVTVQVKIEEAEDGSTCDVKALGSKEELERFCEALKLSEKGKIRVPGLMENFAALSDE